MVLTRSAAAKLSQSKQQQHIPYLEQYYSASDDDSSDAESENGSMDVDDNDTESVSGTEDSTSSHTSSHSSDFDHIDEKPHMFDYFVDAMLDRDWLNSQFHERIIDLYIRPLLSFNGASNGSVIDHIHDITEARRVDVINVKKQVRQCDLCKLTKTVTKVIRVTDEDGRVDDIHAGRHCAQRYMAVVNFYKSTDKFFDAETSKFMEQLNGSLVALEDAMKCGLNALLNE